MGMAGRTMRIAAFEMLLQGRYLATERGMAHPASALLPA